jgi:hypothetical protein
MAGTGELTESEIVELERLAEEGGGEQIGEIAQAWLNLAKSGDQGNDSGGD